jgi:pyrroline-5-carboxylate reductase
MPLLLHSLENQQPAFLSGESRHASASSRLYQDLGTATTRRKVNGCCHSISRQRNCVCVALSSSQAGIEIDLIGKQHWPFLHNGALSGCNGNGRASPEQLMKVTTPKGCTIAGLNEMEMHGFMPH